MNNRNFTVNRCGMKVNGSIEKKMKNLFKKLLFYSLSVFE